jgi:hypothetical protein
MTRIQIKPWRPDPNIITVQEVTPNDTVTKTIYCNIKSTNRRHFQKPREKITKDNTDTNKIATIAYIVKYMMNV